jgi:hypothetical protein
LSVCFTADHKFAMAMPKHCHDLQVVEPKEQPNPLGL